MLPALPVQRPRSHQRPLLIDAEGVVLVSIHNGEGERRAVVRGVAVGDGELQNAGARRSVLLRGGSRAENVGGAGASLVTRSSFSLANAMGVLSFIHSVVRKIPNSCVEKLLIAFNKL